MRDEVVTFTDQAGESRVLPLTWVHTLVVGSGAAGLSSAIQLGREGIEDVCIVTEGLDRGASVQSGSDKQTYYKLSLCGADGDSPRAMAETYLAGGGMHGDLALVEAALSARAFLSLVDLGVAFPQDRYGQFVGYQTDNDPGRRATSIGPYTSRQMCLALGREVRRRGLPVREGRCIIHLLTVEDGVHGRCAGVLAVTLEGQLEAYGAENVVLAVGGPGGLYQASVYPAGLTGAIGVAMMAGAVSQGLPESQYGLASTKFRWNMSGTYMQVIPRFISTAPDGRSDVQEFLCPYFDSPARLASTVFLKGYQWPFDTAKVIEGSSLIDLLVYQETVIRGRRVFLDYVRNPAGFSMEDLSPEARTYLARSSGLQASPIERLAAMNPDAIEVAASRGVDLRSEPLEVAVCAQHNNGGLAANCWWESVNIKHLFLVGEVNGSHGVARPGGSALNAGQVGAFRAAEFIGHRYRGWSLEPRIVHGIAATAAAEVLTWLDRCETAQECWREQRSQFQVRMSGAGGPIRSKPEVEKAVQEAWQQWDRINRAGVRMAAKAEIAEALQTRYLCFAHAVYLSAIAFSIESEVGSRGGSLVLHGAGSPIHPGLDASWRMQPEAVSFRDKVLETVVSPDGRTTCRWVDRRPLPQAEAWFETAWAQFKEGRIYD